MSNGSQRKIFDELSVKDSAKHMDQISLKMHMSLNVKGESTWWHSVAWFC